MKQQAVGAFAKFAQTTRRAKLFLADMDCVVPWRELAAVVQRHYPKLGPDGGRPPV